MKKLVLGRRKLLVAGLVAVVIVGAVALWFFVIKKDQPAQTNAGTEQTTEPLNEAPTLQDYNFPSIDQIIEDAATQEEAAITLVTYGQLKESVTKYEDALVLFEAVSRLQDIPLSMQQAGLAGVYRAAEKTGNTAKQAEARAKLGEEAFTNYFLKSYREDQR